MNYTGGISGGAGESVDRRTLFAGAAAGLAGASVLAGAGPAAAASSSSSSGTVSLDWLDVTDTAYAGGATGDGSTDDTAAIQAALDAIGGGGGVVYFPYGHYLISAPLTAVSGTMLLGECSFGMYPAGTAGGQAPTIVLAKGFSGAAAIDLSGVSSALTGIRIEGLVLNGGNLPATGSTAGVLLSGSVTNVVLRHVVASTFPGTGFSLQLSAGGTPVAYMERCTAWKNGGHGYDLYTSDCEITGCMAFENTLNGFNLQHVDDVQFLGCRAEHNGENGFYYYDANATSTILFDACTTDQNNQNGFLISGASGNGPVQLTGCSLRRDGNNAEAGSTTYAGLALAGSAIPVVVTGTNVQAMSGDNGGYGPHYAVKMTTSSFLSLVGGYFGCEATGSAFDWDGAGALRLSSSVLTGVTNSGPFPGTTTTSAPASPFGAPPPSANGFIAWTSDPWVAPTSASVGTAKYLYLNAVYVHAPAVTTKAWFHVSVAGSGVTSGANWVALYNAAGTLVASAAIDASATSTGIQSVAWKTSTVLAPGMYFVGIVFDATTMPQLYRSSESLLAAMNANLTPAAYRTSIAMGGTAYTTAPASITPSSNVQSVSSSDAQPYWLAIS
jgi:Pectate lyase superfamily protein